MQCGHNNTFQGLSILQAVLMKLELCYNYFRTSVGHTLTDMRDLEL